MASKWEWCSPTGWLAIMEALMGQPLPDLKDIGLAVLTVALMGCGSMDVENPRVESLDARSSQRVERGWRGEHLSSKESNARLELPRGWRPVSDNDLHPGAELQAYHPNREIYFIVVGEDRATVAHSGDLNQQAQIYLQILKSGLDRILSQENTTGVARINGLEAVQYDLSGTVFGADVAYLHTTVATNDRYYQVVAWTPNNRFPENIDDMKAIIQNFNVD
jgi:hypothetical protein